MQGKFDYTLFGLRIRSEIELPELPLARHAGKADVTIALGRLPPAERSADDYLLGADGAGFVVADVAGYWVSEGSRIIVEANSEAPARNVRLYLLGSAMGIMLHQRGLLPLHANAIDMGGRAIAFVGQSGAGKSTLAGAFHDRGYRVLTDDVCVVGHDSGQWLVYPGIPRLRLSEEAMTAAGREPRNFHLSYLGDDSFRKFDVPLPASSQPLPLLAIYQLANGEAFHICPMRGAAAAQAVFANTYRGAFVRSGGQSEAHWNLAVQMIGSVPVFEFRRPRDLARIANSVDAVANHVQELLAEKSDLSAD